MLNKLATLTAVFVLALSAAAFASPIDRESPADTGGAVAAERADLDGANDQDEFQFVLYLGPQDDAAIPQADDDRRVN